MAEYGHASSLRQVVRILQYRGSYTAGFRAGGRGARLSTTSVQHTLMDYGLLMTRIAWH